MKKLLAIFVFSLTVFSLTSQSAPQSISYQAIARDDAGNIIANKDISIKLSLLQGTTTGTKVYEETHRVTTGKTGLINLQIGRGSIVEGTFSAINWANTPFFVKFSMDITGNSDFKEVATSELLSVPYALYAEKAKFIDNHDFLIMPDEVGQQMMSGLVSTYDVENSIYFYVFYQDGIDQKVNCRIEGLPETSGFVVEKNSNKNGSYILLKRDKLKVNPGFPDEAKGVKIIFQNNKNRTKEFLFDVSLVDITPPPIIAEDFSFDKNKDGIVSEEEFAEFLSIIPSIDETHKLFNKKPEYFPHSSKVLNLWAYSYINIAKINTLIHFAEKTNVPFSEKAKHLYNNMIAQRGKTYLMLTQWFGDVPLITKRLNPNENRIKRTDKNLVLEQVIKDLNLAKQVNTRSTISEDEIDILICEANLLLEHFDNVQNYASEGSLVDFCKKVASFKKGTLTNTTNEQLMKEYKEQFSDTDYRDNLFRQVLGIHMEPTHHILLPIPERELMTNPNIRQNPGY